MAETEIKMRMTAEDGDATKAFQRQEEKQKRLRKSTKKTTEEFKKQTKAQDEGLKKTKQQSDADRRLTRALIAGSAARERGAKKSAAAQKKQIALSREASRAFNVKLAAAGVLAVAGAWKLAASEMRAVIDLQKEMNTSQVTLAQAQDKIVRNFSGTKKEIEAILESVRQLPEAVGIKEHVAGRAIAAGLTASAGDVPGTLAAVRVAAKFSGSSPEDIPALTSAILNIEKVTGSKNVLENFGLFKKTAELSAIEELSLQAKNIPRALVSAVGFGATPIQGAALFSSLTAGAVEKTGESIGTVIPSAGAQLEEFFEENRAARRIDKKAGGLGLGGQIDVLIGNRKLAEDFFSGASFEKKLLVPMRDLLLNPESVTASKYQEFLVKFGNSADLIATAERSFVDLQTTEIQRNAAVQRSQEAATEQLRTADPAIGQKSVARETLTKALTITRRFGELQTGMGAIIEAREIFGGDVREFAPEIIRSRIEELGKGRRLGFFGGGRGEVTEEDLSVIDILNRMADSLDEQNTARKEKEEGIQAAPIKEPLGRNLGLE